MKLHTYTLTEFDIQENVNCAKDAILTVLEKEGLLKDTADNIASQYIIVIGKKNLFGSIYDKIFGIKDDKMFYQVVKVL
jgi:hypothetical protein